MFGSGLTASTGLPEKDEEGIVCFITVAGFLNGPGFERMRDDLRRTCSDIWVVDCSPEGHQPEIATRIFQDVQQPVCIVLAARKLGKIDQEPARVQFRALPKSSRVEKFAALNALSLYDFGWVSCPSGWRDTFLPAATGLWASFAGLQDLFIYDGSGVMPGRTWIIAPDIASLNARWSVLTSEKDPAKKEILFHPHEGGDKTVSKKSKAALAGHEHRSEAVQDDQKPAITPMRYGFRSFDRQWIIPDARLINRPNPTLWNAYSPRQVYLTALEAHSPSSGPAATFTGLIPDLHHYKGSFGGRAHPLWRDSAGVQPNIKPALLTHLAQIYGQPVKAEDVLAYLAAILAHPAFTARFTSDLVRPGLRAPVTADASLFAEAVALGSEVIWLHCYGERFADPTANRPKQAPRLPKDSAPYIPAGGGIPSAPEPLPDTMDYDAEKRRLKIGKGYVENVTPKMWAYEVSGKQVLWHWFSYRRRDRSRPIIGDRRRRSTQSSRRPGSRSTRLTCWICCMSLVGSLRWSLRRPNCWTASAPGRCGAPRSSATPVQSQTPKRNRSIRKARVKAKPSGRPVSCGDKSHALLASADKIAHDFKRFDN